MENTLTPEIRELIDATKRILQGKAQPVPDLQIANASYSVLDQYRWLPDPTPPQKVAEYLKMPVDAKKKMNEHPENYKPFWDDTEVRTYFDTKLRIKNINNRNKDWLKWMKEVLADDVGKVAAIDLMLHKFSDDYVEFIEQPRWGN